VWGFDGGNLAAAPARKIQHR